MMNRLRRASALKLPFSLTLMLLVSACTNIEDQIDEICDTIAACDGSDVAQCRESGREALAEVEELGCVSEWEDLLDCQLDGLICEGGTVEFARDLCRDEDDRFQVCERADR